jgi:hypothetical protein
MKTANGMRGRVALREMKRHQERAELQSLYGSEMVNQQLEQMRDAFKSGDPEKIMEAWQTSLRNVMQTMMPSGPSFPSDAAGVARHETMHAAYNLFPGTFVEYKQSGGFIIWDFEEMLRQATKVEYFPHGQKATIENDIGQLEISGRAVEPFLRYLHYIGVFMSDNLRRACPECAPADPKDCENCGGLGWLISDTEQ